MTPTFERIAELRARGRRAAVATLVATTGGAIRRLGETMWVDDHGDIVGSVTIGGCVDGRAVELAEDVLRSGESRRATLALGDEDAWAFGMTCAGNVDLLVEAVDVATSDDPVAVAAAAVSDAIRSGHLALEVVSLGATPRRLVILDDGSRVGTLGSTDLDVAVADRAGSLIDTRRVGVISVVSEAGATDLFVHAHTPPPAVVVMGATDVAVALVRLAGPLGYHTSVVDGRERFANRERFPSADALHVGMPSELIAGMSLTPLTALVLVAHDFKYDIPVLEVALRTRVGYIGVLGSRRRAAVIKETLASIGFTDADIARIRIPVGLDIGARTSGEIALSVLAELVAVQRDKPVSAR
ncbi:MAG TPA: XdhC family protein [Gemmatimonadaceae bacterium]|nr:XdhC family protein [Gemmatimonadaceae bacterium]